MLESGTVGGLTRAVTLLPLTLELARTANRRSFLTRTFFGRLFIMPAQFHFAIDAFALQLFLKRAQGLINIVVANHDLHLYHHFQIDTP